MFLFKGLIKVVIICGFWILFSGMNYINIKLGKSQTSFNVGEIYQTTEDGLLYLEHDCSNNQICLQLLIGDSPNNLENYAQIKWFGTITLPIEENKYWMVKYSADNYKEFVRGIRIRWNPIIGCKKCDK